MRNFIKLIKSFDIFAFLPTMLGVHDLLKRGKVIKAYRYYRLKTGKGLYETKSIIDRYYQKHFLKYKI